MRELAFEWIVSDRWKSQNIKNREKEEEDILIREVCIRKTTFLTIRKKNKSLSRSDSLIYYQFWK